MYVLDRHFLIEWKERKNTTKPGWGKHNIISEFKTATHHRQVPPDYSFLFVFVKST